VYDAFDDVNGDGADGAYSDDGGSYFDFTNDSRDAQHVRGPTAVCAYCNELADFGHCCETMNAFLQSGLASPAPSLGARAPPLVTPTPHVAPQTVAPPPQLRLRGLNVLLKFLLEMQNRVGLDEGVQTKKLRQMVLMQLKNSPDLTDDTSSMVAEAVRTFDELLDAVDCRSVDDLSTDARLSCLQDVLG
jgi:hypothetical protein